MGASRQRGEGPRSQEPPLLYRQGQIKAGLGVDNGMACSVVGASTLPLKCSPGCVWSRRPIVGGAEIVPGFGNPVLTLLGPVELTDLL